MSLIDTVESRYTDQGAPERRDGESWMSYHRRWWFYWTAKDAAASKQGDLTRTRNTNIPVHHGKSMMKLMDYVDNM